jgi:hypothetical protein
MTAALPPPNGDVKIGTKMQAEPVGGNGAALVAAARTMAAEKRPLPRGMRAARMEQAERCADLLNKLPPLDASTRYVRSWAIQSSLDQHGSLKRQREILMEIARSRVQVRQAQASLAEVALEEALLECRTVNVATATPEARAKVAAAVKTAAEKVRLTSHALKLEVSLAETRMAVAIEEIRKSQDEMRALKKGIDDKNRQREIGVQNIPDSERQYYCTNCKVGGHGARFCEYLLKRPNWNVFPHQKWFQDDVKGDQYFCPLGKHEVDFVDETQFSSVAMYLKGRIWLEEKTRVWEMVPEIMPPTYIIVNRVWKGDEPPEAGKLGLNFGTFVEAPADQGWWEAAQKEPTAKALTDEQRAAIKDIDALPWFLKEADRNWGTSVRCFTSLDECMRYAKPEATYVVQRHIARPLLYEGRKAHIKFYILVNALAEGKKWQYWSLRDGYLSVAPHPWSPKDVTKDMQVTIVRSQRCQATWSEWPNIYPKCRDATKIVFRRAVAERKLEAREKAQFEIMSADYIVDEDLNVYLLEFNTSPVLKDPKDSPETNDGAMIEAALGIVFPWEGSDSSPWELADEFEGPEYIPTPQENGDLPGAR